MPLEILRKYKFLFIRNLQFHFLLKGNGNEQTNDFANVNFLQFLHVSFENENFKKITVFKSKLIKFKREK